MIELKPCPFCGSAIEKYTAEIIKEGCKELSIDCSCGAHFFIEPELSIEDRFFSVKRVFENGDAVELWNRRSKNVRA